MPDNAQPAVIEALLEEVALFGEAIVRRIYGDVTLQENATWKKVALHALNQGKMRVDGQI